MRAAKDARRGSEDARGRGSAKYGMTVEPITPEIARELELDRDAKGVVITDVDPSGAAASAGLREGDVIQQVNGKSVRTAEEVRSALSADGRQAGGAVDRARQRTVFVPLRR